jgi:hypothetical protein
MKYVVAFIFPGISLLNNNRKALGWLFLIIQIAHFVSFFALTTNKVKTPFIVYQVYNIFFIVMIIVAMVNLSKQKSKNSPTPSATDQTSSLS